MSRCIEWQYAKDRDGYGRVRMFGKNQQVHRLTYRMYHDIDKDEMPKVVRHSCDNPSCYNIEHLEGGTDADNVRDCLERGRHNQANKTHCPQGHPYFGDNLYVYKKTRHCKECNRTNARNYYRSKNQ